MKNMCELCQLYSPSGCAKLSNEPCLKEAVQLLKDSATNGDMIKAVFSNVEMYEQTPTMTYYGMMRFDTKWWNAPYNGIEGESR